jgi:hypothetical protein
MASDVRIWTGAAWESIKGTPGPTVVSADAVNLCKLGTDGRLLVAQADLDARYVNVAGDWMSGSLALGGTDSFTTTAPLDIDATTYRLRQPKTPASQTDIGEQGTVCWDTAYLYACVAPNQWRRIAWKDWDGAVTGGSWAPMTPASAPLFNISYGGGLFHGDFGKWSTDGSNWFAGTGLPTSGNYYSCAAFGNGTWVRAVKSLTGTAPQFFSSADGKVWASRLGAAATAIAHRVGESGVAFGAGRFVAMVNSSGTATGNVGPRHSTDGITWANSAAPTGLVANTLSDITAVAFGSGLFVAVGNSGGAATARYLTSPDGITWTARSLPIATLAIKDMAFGNGRFVAVATGNVGLTSIDGINWSQITLPAGADWASVTYGGGRWIAVATTTSTAAQSPDGITWTTQAMPSAAAWNGIATDGTVFVATNGTTTPALFGATPQTVTYFPISASRTLVSTDAGAIVANVTTAASPVTLLVPTNAALAFPIGTSITVMDASSTATTTIKADAGVTLNWSGKLVGTSATVLGGVGVEVQIPGPLSQVVLRKVAADSWTILY